MHSLALRRGSTRSFRSVAMPICPYCRKEGTELGSECRCVEGYYIADSALDEAQRDRYIGRKVDDKYVVISQISKGGMGAVYLAIQHPVERKVALKVLRADLEDNDEIRERFEREAQAVASIHHPNIITLHDYGVDTSDFPYMVMEYAPGTGLHDWIYQQQPSLDRILHVVRQMLSALADAHDAGVVHRDLKPENVIVRGTGTDRDFIKLLDFGIARLINEQTNAGLTKEGEVFGTPNYMSPEQAEGQTGIDTPADVYAVGIIIYEMLCAECPFDAPKPMTILFKQTEEPLPAIEPRLGLDVPAGLKHVVRKATSKSPSERFADAGTMLEALEEVIDKGSPTLDEPATTRAPLGRASDAPTNEDWPDADKRPVAPTNRKAPPAPEPNAMSEEGGELSARNKTERMRDPMAGFSEPPGSIEGAAEHAPPETERTEAREPSGEEPERTAPTNTRQVRSPEEGPNDSAPEPSGSRPSSSTAEAHTPDSDSEPTGPSPDLSPESDTAFRSTRTRESVDDGSGSPVDLFTSRMAGLTALTLVALAGGTSAWLTYTSNQPDGSGTEASSTSPTPASTSSGGPEEKSDHSDPSEGTSASRAESPPEPSNPSSASDESTTSGPSESSSSSNSNQRDEASPSESSAADESDENGSEERASKQASAESREASAGGADRNKRERETSPTEPSSTSNEPTPASDDSTSREDTPSAEARGRDEASAGSRSDESEAPPDESSGTPESPSESSSSEDESSDEGPEPFGDPNQVDDESNSGSPKKFAPPDEVE